MRRLGGWVVAAAAAGLMLCAPAYAVLPPPGLEVGGGSPFVKRDVPRIVLSAAVGADGRTVRLGGNIGAVCGKGPGAVRRFLTTVTLADDGSFTKRGVRTTGGYGALLASGRVDVSGTFDGTSAAGAIRLYDVRLADGRPRCRDAGNSFVLRDPGQPAGPAAPAPAAGTPVYGLTSARVNGLRGGVIARVAPNGRTLDELNITVRVRCDRVVGLLEQFTPVKRLRADGRFDTRERFPVTFGNAIERWRARTRGGFQPGGALAGRFDASITRRYTSGRLDGRRVRCNRAAGLRFWAVP